MAFDFDAAVVAPMRMQPGLRRLAAGSAQLTPLRPGSRHQREKLAVLCAFWPQALCCDAGFDPLPALRALGAQAAAEHPAAWQWDGHRAVALGVAVTTDGELQTVAQGVFGHGAEIPDCLRALPREWRFAGLLSLAFAEDLAIVDGRTAALRWLAVALPSHWAPERKIGLHFAEVHRPVPDADRLRQAGDSLMSLVSAGEGAERWERFVWNVTDQPRLHAHPDRCDPQRWAHTAVDAAWWRTERQTFIPLPERREALFLIGVDVQPLAQALSTAERAAALHAAVASMTPAVLAYRGLAGVRDALLQWLAARADHADHADHADRAGPRSG